ncbi:MAG: nitrogenase component 1 [Treponema sp.]
MRGLFRYLSPFTPDQSGAASVLFELGGIIIICDAGGCAGNVCGFDEPRFQMQKSAVFSACLRDMDAIMGRDDKLVAKVGDALKSLPDAKFVAYIGTPVPSVIATDYKALCRMTEKKFGVPTIACATNGMDSYDKGEEKIYISLIERFADGCKKDDSLVGVWGATPLDVAALDSGNVLRESLGVEGKKVVVYGMGSTLDDFKNCGAASVNYVVSVAGLTAAKYLEKKFGTKYKVISPVSFDEILKLDGALSCGEKYLSPNNGKRSTLKLDENLTSEEKHLSSNNGAWALARLDNASSSVEKDLYSNSDAKNIKVDGPVLIISQQFMANGVREFIRGKMLHGENQNVKIDCATFFDFEKSYTENGDCYLPGEDDLIRLVEEKKYRTIICDTLFMRALPDFDGKHIPLPHYAVSGQLNAVKSEKEFVEQIIRGFEK